MGLKPVKVSQLNSYIKRILQTDPLLGNVSVTGEVSNLKFHSSGHIYFSLKDETSRINCFLSSERSFLADEMNEGTEVILTGYIYLHERGGSYSLNVKNVEIAGRGELAKRFENLKKKLEAKGYFDREYKKKLPSFPGKIAVVTSDSGAAVRDILKIIRNKNDYTDIFIYPVLVQGPGAASEISYAIDDINSNFNDVDIIITGRGGGSAEELWAFNEEIVADSIFASNIPIISAVGHETDFTIADFVADVRAETPTAAAEIAVPDTFLLREQLLEYLNELRREISRNIENRTNRVKALNIDNLGQDIRNRIVVEQMRIESLSTGIYDNIMTKMSYYSSKLAVIKEALDAADPQTIMSKGYSVITDSDGNIIKDIYRSLNYGDLINIKSYSGQAEARITKLGKE